MAVNGPALAAVSAGALFAYAGVTGKSILGSARALINGKAPSTAPKANTIADQPQTSTTDTVPSQQGSTGTVPITSNAQQALQQAAAQRGWGSGAQWQALQNVEMREAGFSTTIKNPSSGALGLAQALGHGQGSATAGTLGNEYGGFGLTDAQAQAANSGDAGAQALWMVNYIAATYGNPENAWAHEQSQGWY